MPNAQFKVPKGTCDLAGTDVLLRETTLAKIRDVFQSHDAREIDTPVFELQSILKDKYGAESKLIYDLKDQGGEPCALRYHLTVPFARWLAISGTHRIKRFQIGKMYRRVQPAIECGRMRESHQCDFDYAGAFDVMIADIEVLSITAEVFEALELDVTIKINHRLILDGIFDVLDIPHDLIRPISSALDNLHWTSWGKVKEEMAEKGLQEGKADLVRKYVFASEGDRSFLETLKFSQSNESLSKNEEVQKGIDELALLLRYLTAYNIARYIKLDLSLVRGLEYYTGLIYEVVPSRTSLRVDSIAADGRHDSLVGMFSKTNVPCVGISFGIDRILTILKRRKDQPHLSTKVDVYIVAYGGPWLVEEKLSTARMLRKAGISVDSDTKADGKPGKQLDLAELKCATLAVILEEAPDVSDGVRFKVFHMLFETARDARDAEVVDRAAFLEHIRERL